MTTLLLDQVGGHGQGPQGSAPAGDGGPAGAPGLDEKRRKAYGRVALDQELILLRNAPEGTRHNTTYRVSIKAGSLIESGCLVEEPTTVEIEEAALASGISVKQIRRIRRNIRRGIAKGKQNPRGPNLEETGHRVPVGTFAAAVLGAARARGVEFKGVRGNTAWAIGAALCTKAETSGKHHDPVEAPYRQLGELARVGTVSEKNHYDTEPIRHALAFLIEHDVIEQLVHGRGRQSSVFRVLPLQRMPPQTSTASTTTSLGSSANRFGEPFFAVTHHVVWDRLGLGAGAQRVQQALVGRGRLTTAEIAKLTGITPQGVRGICKRMRRDGLVEQDTSERWPRWWWTGRDLDEVAVELGVQDRDAKRRHAHTEQRIVFAAQLLTEMVADGSIDVETGEILSDRVEPKQQPPEADPSGRSKSGHTVEITNWGKSAAERSSQQRYQEAVRLAGLFSDLIEARGWPRPSTAASLSGTSTLLVAHSPLDVEGVIRWALASDYWAPMLRTGWRLVDLYDRIWLERYRMARLDASRETFGA